MKRKFRVNGQLYEINESDVSAFLIDFPGAVDITKESSKSKQYEVNGKKYDVPINETEAFETDFGLKKKEPSPTSKAISSTTKALSSAGSIAGSSVEAPSEDDSDVAVAPPPVKQVPKKESPSLSSVATGAGDVLSNAVFTKDGKAFVFPHLGGVFSSYKEELQSRLSNGVITDEDAAFIAVNNNTTRGIVRAYVKSINDGRLREQVEKENSKITQLLDGLINLEPYYTRNKVSDLMDNPDAQKDFIEYFETLPAPYKNKTVRASNFAKTGLLVEESDDDYNKRPDVAEYNKKKQLYSSIANILKEKAIEPIVDRYNSGEITKEEAADLAASVQNPVNYRLAKKALGESNGLDALSDKSSFGEILRGVIDEFKGGGVSESIKKNTLNSVMGEGELAFQNALAKRTTQLLYAAREAGDENSVSNIKTKFESAYDKDAIYKYPTLVERQITAEITDRIASVAGQKAGTDTEDVSLKILNDTGSKYRYAEELLKEKGYLDNPKTAEIARTILMDIVSGTDKIGDASYLGGAFKSFKQPFVGLFKAVGDLTGFRKDSDLISEKLTAQYFPEEVEGLNKNVSIIRNIVNTTSNILGQAALQYGTMGIGKAASLSPATARSTAFWVSGSLPAYDQAYKNSMDFIDNPAERQLFSFISAAFTGYTERIFQDVKLFEIPGAKEALTKLAGRVGTKEFTRELTKEALNETKKSVVDFGVKYIKNVGQETLEEVTDQVFNDIEKMIFGDPNTNMSSLMKNAEDTFIQTVIGTSLIGGMGAYSDSRNEKNTSFKSSLYNAAIYHDKAEDALLKGLQSQAYDEAEYNSKIQLLNTARQEVSNLNKIEKIRGREFDIQQRQVYVANRVAELSFKKQLEATPDEFLQKEIEGKISNLKSQRERIYGEDVKFDETLREVIKPEVTPVVLQEQNLTPAKDALSAAVSNKELTGMYAELAVDNPTAVLKDIAEQAQGVDENGNPRSGGPAVEALKRMGVSDELIESAIAAFPAPVKSLMTNTTDDFQQRLDATPATQKLEVTEKGGRVVRSYENTVSVNDLINQQSTYKGQRGMIQVDGQTAIFKVEGQEKEYELGNIEEIGGTSVKDFGIEQEDSVVASNEAGDITVRGKAYKNNYSNPLSAINRDENGEIVSVNLDTQDGKKRTFRGDVAEDIAYQIHLKQINSNNETAREFEDFINSDEAIAAEVNDAGVSEATPAQANGDNAPVQREKIQAKPRIRTTGEIRVVAAKVEAVQPDKIADDIQHNYGNTLPQLKMTLDDLSSSTSNEQSIETIERLKRVLGKLEDDKSGVVDVQGIKASIGNVLSDPTKDSINTATDIVTRGINSILNKEELIKKIVASQPERTTNEQGQTEGITEAEGATTKAQNIGQDVIGSRSRSESDKDASRKAAKEKIKSPKTNVSLKAANSYNKSAGLPPVTSHKFSPADQATQTKIAELYPQLQDVTRPEYKETDLERSIYEGYKSAFPEIFEEFDIKDYKDLVEKSYAQLVLEANRQFEILPVGVDFHEGDKNYESSSEMLDDVHNFGHLWVFQGGDDHTLLGSKTIDEDGLTANDKFRAVHDFFGHSIEGYQFGKDGERNAWAEHSKMFSPLAQWALSSETNGQNSFVNFSGVNEIVLEKIKLGSVLKKQGIAEGNKEMTDDGQKLIEEAGKEFIYADQKSMLLPVEYTDVSGMTGSRITEVPSRLKQSKPQPTAKVRSKEELVPVKSKETKKVQDFEKSVDDAAEKLIAFLTPKTTEGVTKSGLGIPEIVKAGAEVIKQAYRLEKNIEKAISKGIAEMKKLWKQSFGDAVDFPENDLREKLNTQFGVKDATEEVKAVASDVKANRVTYPDSIAGKDQKFIDALNKELYGNQKFNVDETGFRESVKKQKEFGLSKEEIVEGLGTIKKLTKRQSDIIEDVFMETAENDAAAAELQEAMKSISEGQRPKSVLKSLSVSNVTALVKNLSNTLNYTIVSNRQLEDIADWIVGTMDLDNAQDYLNSMYNNNLSDVKQLVRAKAIVALQGQGNEAMATQIIEDMADDAVAAGRQNQSLKRAYEILGIKGNPKTRTAFAKIFSDKVKQRALLVNQKMAEVISQKEAEIGKLNERIHEIAQRASGFSKIRDIIDKICNIRRKK